MKRLAIVAVGLALVLGIGPGCEAGPSSEMKDYAREMKQWYDSVSAVPVREDLVRLHSINNPAEMYWVHELLRSTVASLVLADEDVQRLEYRDQTCANRSFGSVSPELEMACERRDAADTAYVAAEFVWAEWMSEACGLGWPISYFEAIDGCLGGE